MSRVVRASQAFVFVGAMAKRARRMMKRGWKPACMEWIVDNCPGCRLTPGKDTLVGPCRVCDGSGLGPCGAPATHVAPGPLVLCAAHVEGKAHAQQIQRK